MGKVLDVRDHPNWKYYIQLNRNMIAEKTECNYLSIGNVINMFQYVSQGSREYISLPEPKDHFAEAKESLSSIQQELKDAEIEGITATIKFKTPEGISHGLISTAINVDTDLDNLEYHKEDILKYCQQPIDKVEGMLLDYTT